MCCSQLSVWWQLAARLLVSDGRVWVAVITRVRWWPQIPYFSPGRHTASAADNYRHLSYLQPWETRPGAWLVLSILNIIHAFCVKLLLFSQHSSGTTWQTTCILHPNVSFWVYLLWPNCWTMRGVRMACIHRLILAPSCYIATCNIKLSNIQHSTILPTTNYRRRCHKIFFGCRQRCFYFSYNLGQCESIKAFILCSLLFPLGSEPIDWYILSNNNMWYKADRPWRKYQLLLLHYYLIPHHSQF